MSRLFVNAVFLWALPASMGLLREASAQAEGQDSPPTSIRIEGRATPSSVLYLSSIKGFVGGVHRENRKELARGTFIRSYDDLSPLLPRGATDKYTLRFPDLHQGDIVGIFGAVYGVAGLSAGNGTARDRGAVVFVRLPYYDLTAPEGVTAQKGCYLFTIGVGGGGGLHNSELDVAFVAPDPAKNAAAAVDLTIRPRSNPDVVEAVTTWRKATVRVGDILVLDGFKHRVANIVAPDADRHIIGWFELEPAEVAKPEKP